MSAPSVVTKLLMFTINYVDVERMKDMKRMITLLAITSQFIPQNRHGSERLRKLANRVRKQMLINTHKVNRCEQM